MKFANDGVVDDQRVHKVIGKVVEADAPRFFSDFCGPRMIDVVGSTPTQLVSDMGHAYKERPQELVPAAFNSWLPAVNNLRNFFLTPTAEMLSFLQ